MAIFLRLFAPLAASLQGPPSPWCRTVLCGIALWGMGGIPPALAQAPSPCEPLLAAAEEQYVNREFTEAEDLVRVCLAEPELGDEEALRAYRLLALIFLRQDDLPEARQAVVRLLGVSFEYEPDPIQDPPAYVGLVTSIKDQLRVERVLPPPDSARVAPPAPLPEVPEAEPEIQIVQTDPDPPEDAAPTAEPVAARERSGITRWLLIGGGVIVAGVAGLLLTGGDSPPGGTSLPPPPAFPR